MDYEVRKLVLDVSPGVELGVHRRLDIDLLVILPLILVPPAPWRRLPEPRGL